MTTRALDIKNYLNSLFGVEDAVLLGIKEEAKKEGLPEIEVPPSVGRLLYCLAKIKNPKKVLEIGTLAGYSTVWLARALSQEAKIISLELEKHHVEVAQKNIAQAGFGQKVEVRLGKAAFLLDQMIAQKEGPFELIFIDADKENYCLYLEKALELSQIGTLILSDNLIPKGEEIGNPHPKDNIAKSIYQFNKQMASHPRLESVLTTTLVGNTGRIDALGISIVSK